MESRKIVFDRNDTKAIKGIAVVLMLFHHLAGFPYRTPAWFGGFESMLPGFVEDGYLEKIAFAAILCVPVFAFLGGYGLFKRMDSSKFSMKDTILGLYSAYWKVFLVFVPLDLIFFMRNGAETNVFYNTFTYGGGAKCITEILSDFLGYSNHLNPEWWFFRSYICALLLGYLFCLALKKTKNLWVDIFLVFGLDILIRNIFPAISGMEAFTELRNNRYFWNFLMVDKRVIPFFAGIVFAKHDIVCKVKKTVLDMPCSTLVALLGLGILYWSKTFIVGETADILYCGIMIPLLSIVLDKLRILKKAAGFLGKHSTNMWLIHSFYCFYFLEVTHLVYVTHNVWVDLCILVVLSLLSSILLNGFWTGVKMICGKIGRRKSGEV